MSKALKIVKVHNGGSAASEFVQLYVHEKCQPGKFMLMDSTYSGPGMVSNKLRHAYWFPGSLVSNFLPHEQIFLHTSPSPSGKEYVREVLGKIVVHHFYWGLKESIWNDTGDLAILFELEDWQDFPVPATKKAA